MASENHGAVLHGIGRIFNQGSLTGLTDGQILRRFAAGDDGAFEALVMQHGSMVLGVCRRLLHDSRDVEDAFQATFLVLLRKAGALRDSEPLGPWLHGVAYRVAARIRAGAARRRGEELRGARPEAVPSACDLERSELRTLIDEEIRRLPEKYRRPVVLCYLEGRTHEEAARRLRCTPGSVRGRLDRARQKLKDRLTRRGVAPAAGLTALAAGGEVASAAVPAPLIAATVVTIARAATATAVSGAASTSALELADGVFRSMLAAKVRLVVGIVAMATIPLVVALEAGAPRMAPHPLSTHPADDRKAGGPAQGIILAGRVLDQLGTPIAGARVARGSDFRGQENIAEVTTGADGRFAMPGVPAGPVVLTVQAPGHAPDLKSVAAGPNLPPVEFRLGAGHTIRGRIVDAHDKPIAGAPIAADEWRGHHSLRWKTLTDAEGRYRWDDAPADGVLIDLGELGFKGKRLWRAMPDAPERNITMRRALHVRGRVTDAQTGRPIKPFTLVPGYTWENQEMVWWENEDAKEVSGLSYDILLSTTAPLRVIRIEAEGYLPGISRRLKDDEEEAVVHLALKRGSGVSGVVRLPDGSPLAGAEVMLATSSRRAHLSNGRSHPSANGQRIVKTRTDGRFSLPPQDPPYTILVLHDRGYVSRRIAAGPTATSDLILQPWSRVEGTLWFGRRPGAKQPLMLGPGWHSDRRDDVIWVGSATTDGEGRFLFDRVRPGEARISRSIRIGDISSGGGNPFGEVDVAPGATLQVTLGGSGRPVVGKAVLPAEVVRHDDWISDFCYLNKKSSVADGTGRWAGASYVFKVEPDGSFRLEDIDAGSYEIHILVNKRPTDGAGPGHDLLASVLREVVVLPMPGVRSDEPFDLGEIPLTAENPSGTAGGKKP